MLARWSTRWWKPVLVGSALTLVFLARGVWALTVVSAAVGGLLALGQGVELRAIGAFALIAAGLVLVTRPELLRRKSAAPGSSRPPQ